MDKADDNGVAELKAQVAELQWGVAALALTVTAQLPLRGQLPGREELTAIVDGVQAQAVERAAEARRQELENELASLGAAA